MAWYAHSGRDEAKGDWQALSDHLVSVATLAGEMGKPLGIEKAAFFAGLLHDLGKYNPDFQKRLEGRDIRVDHSTAGAQILLELAQGQDRMMAEIMAYAILGHHAGLPDRMNGTDASYDRRMEQRIRLDPGWKGEISQAVAGLTPVFLKDFPRASEELGFSLAFLGRMIFSCLVDADFKDTEQFYVALGDVEADRSWPTLEDLLDGFVDRFNTHMAGFTERSGELNALRRDILAHVRAKATEKPGLFTLTVPTGGGKTLASLGFALDHAKMHGHSRIIYAIPFTSIIDQTASIFRQILGDAYVLEHHSAIIEDKFDPKEQREQKNKLKLAMEDWAAPVVVTTNVQLFESLYSARTSRARKVHNIANSVIILDEAQTLPRGLLRPAMRVLEELAAHYGCTIVLCTATQPALGKRDDFPKGLPLAGRELAPDPEQLAARLARTRIRHAGEVNNAALLAALGDEHQALVIVNSRRHALDLYKEAVAEGLDGVIHLTTRQYAAHRRRILEDVRARLKEGRPCRLIATSLIEAGVDVDFPVAWRAEAGLDQIIQAAGRVNREGKRARGESLVTVFVAPDYPPPAEIKGLIGDMKRMIDKHDDLTSLAAIEDYFREVYWRLGEGLDAKKILPRFQVSRHGTDFAYRSVSEDFRMIESGLTPVIIPVDDEAKKVVDQLSIESIPSGKLARELQSFTVQVPPKARDILIRNGHVAFKAPHLRGDQFAVLETPSLYRPEVGLLWEDAEYLGAENSVI
ncbi:MAG: CRISPR-associated helicase Cas3' [Proteobacteria bacterium]|nr:CRISPR-associated helicase Cas3' [Pseudomonadota bacterium]